MGKFKIDLVGKIEETVILAKNDLLSRIIDRRDTKNTELYRALMALGSDTRDLIVSMIDLIPHQLDGKIETQEAQSLTLRVNALEINILRQRRGAEDELISEDNDYSDAAAAAVQIFIKRMERLKSNVAKKIEKALQGKRLDRIAQQINAAPPVEIDQVISKPIDLESLNIRDGDLLGWESDFALRTGTEQKTEPHAVLTTSKNTGTGETPQIMKIREDTQPSGMKDIEVKDERVEGVKPRRMHISRGTGKVGMRSLALYRGTTTGKRS